MALAGPAFPSKRLYDFRPGHGVADPLGEVVHRSGADLLLGGLTTGKLQAYIQRHRFFAKAPPFLRKNPK